MALFAGRATIVVRHDPTWELELAGFSNRGPSTGVHALPQIRAFVFRDSATQQQLAVISGDYCGWDSDFVTGIRRKLKSLGTESIISVTHTHSAPATYHSVGDFTGAVDPRYVELVQACILEAVAAAQKDMSEVTSVAVTHSTLHGNFTMNRSTLRERQTDEGARMWLDKRLTRDTPAAVLADVDRGIALVRFGRPGGDLVLANFACHPVVEGRDNLTCSRDFIGPLLSQIERELDTGSGDVTAMFLQGAAGDVNPAVFEFGLVAAERFGRAIGAEMASAMCEGAFPVSEGLAFREVPVRLENVDGSYHEAVVSCLLIGGQAIVTVPGELYHELGLAIKAGFDLPPIVACYSNGSVGYLPNRERLERSEAYGNDTGIRTTAASLFAPGYGNRTGVPAPGSSEHLVDTIRELLTKMLA